MRGRGERQTGEWKGEEGKGIKGEGEEEKRGNNREGR